LYVLLGIELILAANLLLPLPASRPAIALIKGTKTDVGRSVFFTIFFFLVVSWLHGLIYCALVMLMPRAAQQRSQVTALAGAERLAHIRHLGAPRAEGAQRREPAVPRAQVVHFASMQTGQQAAL
jgi:hypothetical protein